MFAYLKRLPEFENDKMAISLLNYVDNSPRKPK